MNIWNDEEVKSLFLEVENTKKVGKPLREAFVKHAEKFKRKANSVRNYYYHEVDNLEKDSKRMQRLEIDINKHTKNKLVPFTKEQEDKFMKEIELLRNSGESVRSACFKLSGGDMTLMTRLQNKYQNLKKEVPNNIVKFKQKALTDSDINSLFSGLVKLIKRNAVELAEERVREEKHNSAYLLREAYSELAKKDKEIFRVKEDLKRLKLENEKLSLRLNKFFSKSDKLKEKLAEKHAIKAN